MTLDEIGHQNTLTALTRLLSAGYEFGASPSYFTWSSWDPMTMAALLRAQDGARQIADRLGALGEDVVRVWAGAR